MRARQARKILAQEARGLEPRADRLARARATVRRRDRARARKLGKLQRLLLDLGPALERATAQVAEAFRRMAEGFRRLGEAFREAVRQAEARRAEAR